MRILSFFAMKFQTKMVASIWGMFLTGVLFHATVLADNQTVLADTNPLAAPESHGGLFNWLDPRSAYYQDFFPTPLLLEQTSLEKEGEVELTSLNTEANDQRSGIYTVQVEKSFGLLTLELEVPYERDLDAGEISQGIGNINLSARYPLYQFVSANGVFDTTLGVGVGVGIPVNSAVSKNTELTHEIFNDLKLGKYFSCQSVFGYSTLFGGGDAGGLRTFEYGFDFACTIPHGKLPLPGVQHVIPMFELVGETELNRDSSGQNSLLGCMGLRLDLKPIGDVTPSLGLGFVFPMDDAARSEVHWGIATSLVFEF